jgi:predicted RNase H-like HicB family nuclease
MKLTFILSKVRNGKWWSAECAEIPGALSQGRTEKSAKNNLIDAIKQLNEARRAMYMKKPCAAQVSFGRFKISTVEI